MLLIFIKNQIKRLIYPNSIIVIKYNNQKITDEFINSVIIFIFLLFLILSMLLSITGLDFITQFQGRLVQYQMLVLIRRYYRPMAIIKAFLINLNGFYLWNAFRRLELFAVLVLFFLLFGEINMEIYKKKVYLKLASFTLTNV